MQEINDLKNIVIQSLESHGVLSQLRAQIRASVFKVKNPKKLIFRSLKNKNQKKAKIQHFSGKILFAKKSMNQRNL